MHISLIHFIPFDQSLTRHDMVVSQMEHTLVLPSPQQQKRHSPPQPFQHILQLADVYASVMRYLTCHDIFATASRVSRAWYRGTSCDLVDLPRLVTSRLP